jgi:hypothetical protein
MLEKKLELPKITQNGIINKNNLKVYDIFLNNCGYLSMIYAISKNKLHIINYNGNIYTINKNDKNDMTEYVRTNPAITPLLFINSYPMKKYHNFNYTNQSIFVSIKKDIFSIYNNLNKSINKKLLILK